MQIPRIFCLFFITLCLLESDASPVSGPAQCRKPGGEGIISEQYKESYDYGEEVEVRCKPEYYALFQDITCGSSGQWDVPLPCVAAKCKHPEGVVAVRTRKDRLYYRRRWIEEFYSPGDEITVWCHKGYYSPHDTYTCLATENGSDWDRHDFCIPQCKAPSGEEIDLVEKYLDQHEGWYFHFGQRYYDRWDYYDLWDYYDRRDYYYRRAHSGRSNYNNLWDTIMVRCNEGFFTPFKVYTCVSNGSSSDWDNPVSCVAKCKAPRGEGIQSVSPSRKTYDHDDLIAVQCNAGYYPISVAMRCVTTNGSHVWDPPAPCKALNETNVIKFPSVEDDTIKWSWQNHTEEIIGHQLNISARRAYNNSFIEKESHWLPVNISEFKMQSKPGTFYEIQIRGLTLSGAGTYRTWSFETPIAEPPVSVRNEVFFNGTTTYVKLFPATDLNGPISHYEIIVKEMETNSSDVCSGYSSTHYNANPRLYTAAQIPAHNLTQPTTLTLGDGQRYSDFFNAPLNASLQYSVFVRVTSVWNEVKRSSCSVAVFHKGGRWISPSGYIYVSIIVKIILLLMLVLLYFILQRKWRSEPGGKLQIHTPTPANTQTP
uniref:Sushi domain-containing protein n=1 Tax=Leptobrachium leishanense TaxID=445787 RepID=A0A8C5N598_9ANUR